MRKVLPLVFVLMLLLLAVPALAERTVRLPINPDPLPDIILSSRSARTITGT